MHSALLDRRAVLGILPLGLLFLAGVARAEKREILSHELGVLLSGKTIRGTWRGQGYTQYFGTDGRTSYEPDGGSADWERWHLGDTCNYCSTWAGCGESCYRAFEKEGTYCWQPANGGDLQPFNLKSGN